MNKNLINKYLGKFGVEIHGKGYLQSLAKGSFKEDAFQVQKDTIGKEGGVIFDGGANRGDTSTIYRKLFPQADIYAFEPFPGSLEIYRSIHGDDKKIQSFQIALAAVHGEHTLYVNQSVDTNSLLASDKIGLSSDASVKNVSEIKVNTTTLDLFCEENGIREIDILKLDVQGGECAALQGASGLLSRGGIGLVYAEVYFSEQYKEQPLFHDTSKFLHSFGYYLQDFYSPIYGKGRLAWGDAIFTKR